MPTPTWPERRTARERGTRRTPIGSTALPTWFGPARRTIAIFGAGTAGTHSVTLGTVNAGALNFTQGGYTLTGGMLTLNPVSALTGFTAATSGGGTTTISSTLAGTTGTRFMKTGPGTLAIASISGGTAASPTVGTVAGGTYGSAAGYFDSILSMSYADSFGTAPTSAAIQFPAGLRHVSRSQAPTHAPSARPGQPKSTSPGGGDHRRRRQ